MRKATKAGIIAGVLVLSGTLTLALSPGAGRVPLGTLCIAWGLIAAVAAFRLRAAAN